MKKYLFAAVTLLLTSCAVDTAEEAIFAVPNTLEVLFEEDTRIQLMDGKSVWNSGDLVSVFYLSDGNQQWRFDGQTGDRMAVLTRVTVPQATVTIPKIVAIYPYNEDYTVTDECKITATLATEQSYTADSYGIGSSIMVSAGDSEQIRMCNVMGWLKIDITGNGEVVKSITLRGNNNEQVAGGATIDPTNATIALDGNSAETSVALNCAEGVTLGTKAASFYITLPPQEFSRGFTMNVLYADGTSMVKSTSNSLTISRNTIQPMEVITAKTISDNEIWYTSTDGNIVTPHFTDVFGADIVSNTCKDGFGVITFDNPVTKIGDNAFNGCSTLASVVIGNKVTSIENFAFAKCSGLKSITIPDSVTEIGKRISVGCSSLAEFNCRFASADRRCLIVAGTLNSFAPVGVVEYVIPDNVTSIGESAFHSCGNLKSVTIPNSVTQIAGNAFTDCATLATITIPDNVTEIGDYAFNRCYNLSSVYCKPTTPPRLLGNYVFNNNASDQKIYVPSASVDAYKTATNWSRYSANIEPYNF